MKVIFDTAKLHDEVVAAGRKAIEIHDDLCDKVNEISMVEDGILGYFRENSRNRIYKIKEHLEILIRIRDVTAMSSLRYITLSEDEIDIVRKYGRDGK